MTETRPPYGSGRHDGRVPRPMHFTARPKESFPSFQLELRGISRRTMDEHYKLYVGYVNKANEILDELAAEYPDPAKANATYSPIRERKVELSFAIGGVKNHELYFDILGRPGGLPTGRVAQRLAEDFGSVERWADDFRATGLGARGWCWLALDHGNGRLFNYIGDSQNTFPIWNATPVLAIDMYEHAYYLDYATDRAAYVNAFFDNIRWAQVDENLQRACAGWGMAMVRPS